MSYARQISRVYGRAFAGLDAIDQIILGIQKDLKTLGYDPGPLDGEVGPKTRAAAVKFAGDRNIAIVTKTDENDNTIHYVENEDLLPALRDALAEKGQTAATPALTKAAAAAVPTIAAKQGGVWATYKVPILASAGVIVVGALALAWARSHRGGKRGKKKSAGRRPAYARRGQRRRSRSRSRRR